MVGGGGGADGGATTLAAVSVGNTISEACDDNAIVRNANPTVTRTQTRADCRLFNLFMVDSPCVKFDAERTVTNQSRVSDARLARSLKFIEFYRAFPYARSARLPDGLPVSCSCFRRYLIVAIITVAWLHVSGLTEIGTPV